VYTRSITLCVAAAVWLLCDIFESHQVGQYGCGWTYLQAYGPNDAESQTQRDVYRGSPRSLLFFEAGDFQVRTYVCVCVYYTMLCYECVSVIRAACSAYMEV
jgi:hypothetical protein